MTHYMVRKDWALMVTTEWAKTMKVLSNMLIQQVYNLDPESFPLDKPTDKSRRLKGRKTKTSDSDMPVRSVSEEPTKAIGRYPKCSCNIFRLLFNVYLFVIFSLTIAYQI